MANKKNDNKKKDIEKENKAAAPKAVAAEAEAEEADEEALDDEELPEIYTLSDEDGNELNFALLASLEHNGAEYKAFIPVDEEGNEESEEYVILKVELDENGETTFVTVDDDDEFDEIADIFDDKFSDVLYD